MNTRIFRVFYQSRFCSRTQQEIAIYNNATTQNKAYSKFDDPNKYSYDTVHRETQKCALETFNTMLKEHNLKNIDYHL